MVRVGEAAAGPTPPAIAVQAAEALAAVLRGKRRIEEIERFLAVPAEKHAPWPAPGGRPGPRRGPGGSRGLRRAPRGP